MNSPTYVLLFALLLLIPGPLYVEIIGYLWHRFAEHEGDLGEAIRFRHWIHHEEDYPAESLRPSDRPQYKSAQSWSWYLLALVGAVIIVLVIPLKYAFPIILGALLYAKFILSYMHASFHVPKHWLAKYGWYQKTVHRHDIHHLKPANYGVLFYFIDRLMGTLSDEMPATKLELFPNIPEATKQRLLARSPDKSTH